MESKGRLKVYIAAPFERWALAEQLSMWLERESVDARSSWIDVAARQNGVDDGKRPSADGRASRLEQRQKNRQELLEAHLVIALVFDGEGRSMFLELARAIDYGIPIAWCGPPCLESDEANVFAFGDWLEGALSVAAARNAAEPKRGEDATAVRERVADYLRSVREPIDMQQSGSIALLSHRAAVAAKDCGFRVLSLAPAIGASNCDTCSGTRYVGAKNVGLKNADDQGYVVPCPKCGSAAQATAVGFGG